MLLLLPQGSYLISEVLDQGEPSCCTESILECADRTKVSLKRYTQSGGGSPTGQVLGGIFADTRPQQHG